MKQLPVGATAPDFTLQSFQLSQALRDGPLVLAFYKAGCPTCQFTFPYLEKIAHPRLWTIAQDEPHETEAFRKHFGITLPVLIDDHPYDVSRAYGLEYVPAIFMINEKGIITHSDYGFSKATLSTIAGREMFPAEDGIPATRPG